jgi:pimeloyl-ACP methyl ester carboxylesterase
MVPAPKKTIRPARALLARVLLCALFLAVSALHATELRPPVVVIPGAPGTELVDATTGKLLWPNAWLMTVPGGTDCLALPLDDPESAPVVTGGLVRAVRVAGMKFPVRVYGGLEKKLKALGYRAGDWNAPTGEGEFFYFAYDWRQSVETSGRRLSVALAELYGKSPPGTPPAIVLGHSLGGLVARYALMYGDVPLGREGPLPPVTWAGRQQIGTLFLVATPNEGTFIALKRLEKGIYYSRRRGAFSKETLFSFPSVFDVIPGSLAPLVDKDGHELPFHLDDPDDWERIGWSVVDESDDGSTIPRDAIRAHLARELARSARLRTALAQHASTPNPATLYGVAGLSRSVQRTALVTKKKGKMEVRFDPPLGTGSVLKPILFEPGDSMVATRSLAAEGSSHDPTSSLCFTRVLTSKRSHHALLSSPEMLAALVEVLK